MFRIRSAKLNAEVRSDIRAGGMAEEWWRNAAKGGGIWFQFAPTKALFEGAPVTEPVGGMNHAPGFLALVQDAQTRIQELSIEALSERLKANPGLVLLDVREESEWAAGHAEQASHLGKGILERDLEVRYPDKSAEIVMYCGGGYRSALTCDAAQKMGYQNVRSLIGGYKGLVTAGWPMTH